MQKSLQNSFDEARNLGGEGSQRDFETSSPLVQPSGQASDILALGDCHHNHRCFKRNNEITTRCIETGGDYDITDTDRNTTIKASQGVPSLVRLAISSL